MASIYKEFLVKASPEHVWSAIKDVAAIHTRLASGFVVNTVLDGDTRTVTFANGFVVKEQIVSVSEELYRLVYRVVGGRASHHNATLGALVRRALSIRVGTGEALAGAVHSFCATDGKHFVSCVDSTFAMSGSTRLAGVSPPDRRVGRHWLARKDCSSVLCMAREPSSTDASTDAFNASGSKSVTHSTLEVCADSGNT